MSTPAQSASELEREQALRDRRHLQLLLEVNNALVSTLELHDLFRVISSALQRVAHHDYCSLCLHDPKLRQFRVYALDFPGGLGLIHEEVVFKVEGSPAGEAFTRREPLLVEDLNEHRFPSDATHWLLAEGVTSACWVPLIHGENCVGVLCIGSRGVSTVGNQDLPLLSAVASQVAIAVENALAFQEIKELKDKLGREKSYLEDEIRAEYDYEEMVGQSPAWRQVLQQIETVAPTNATVLILGETGTGKELVARAIHNQSSRHERTFVKLNCSAVPTGLLESELFGHEKGAFTGAITQQLGRFELAHKGTLLLDEIGDIPLELQPKLLRALQEQQFERLGSARTIQVDVRLIASTNRNVQEMVANRQFREDLFYRLNVFPIVVPALRERRSDIPTLVRYFVAKYGPRMRKQIRTIPAETMARLTRGNWPGNVRELENLVERAVILSSDGILSVPEGEMQLQQGTAPLSLESVERDTILNALRECRGVIGGARGAAARLGMKRTTLNSRMRKLGISRDEL
jgi:formate hydrogenlyase transcriptional activator